MRKTMTPWERKLWFDVLKNLPQKFTKQKKIGNYIADFYCAKAKLVVELDGSQHYDKENILKDKERTNYFNSLGIKVVRYSNRDVDNHTEAIAQDLFNMLNRKKD